jgi:hypothetical protein
MPGRLCLIGDNAIMAAKAKSRRGSMFIPPSRPHTRQFQTAAAARRGDTSETTKLTTIFATNAISPI